MTDDTENTENTQEGGTEDVAALKAQLSEALKGIEALKAKNEELLGETKAAKQKAREREEAAQKAAEEAAAKSGDVESLTKSWQEKLTKREAELKAEVEKRDAQLMQLTVGATAQNIAGDLAVPGSAGVLAKLVRERLKYEDGKVAVLDAEGKPSALTVDELKKEIAEDPALAPLIAGSRASGGGAAGAKGGGAAKTWDQMTGMERVELRRKNPAEHARLKAAAAANKHK